MQDDPCHKCEERKIGCHSKCKKYIEWAAEKRKINELISKERRVNALATGHVVNVINRNKKYINR